jgi:hypothetical protein
MKMTGMRNAAGLPGLLKPSVIIRYNEGHASFEASNQRASQRERFS